MIPGDGAGTRATAQGMMSTSLALSTSPHAARCVAQLTAGTAPGTRTCAATSVIPPACTNAISGMAAKFSSRPAAVTRENTRALTGKRASSAETDAAKLKAKPDLVVDHDITYAEALPWLAGRDRATFERRFAVRLRDPAFRKAAEGDIARYPLWDRQLHPEKYAPKTVPAR